MKKTLAILLVAVMALSTLFGCGGSSDATTNAATEKATEKATEAAKTEEAATEGNEEGDAEQGPILPDEELTYGTYIKGDPSLYPNVDFSKDSTIYITMVGDTYNDFQDIVDLANEYLAPYHTKLDFTIWAWSDYRKLYSLALAGGENIDLIYTSCWCFLWSEGSNGSFKTLSDDFLNENMPMTVKYQRPESLNGVKLLGNIIALPDNMTVPNGKVVWARKDLVEKYGYDGLKDWNDYKSWLLDIAEKETPESGIFGIGASSDNAQVWNVYREQFDTMEALNVQDWITYYYVYKEGQFPTKDDFIFAWDNDWFKDYCADMGELSHAGAWSRSALTNETRPQDAFGALQGASFCRNTGIPYFEQAEAADSSVECEIYDICQTNFSVAEAYNNNCMAITSSCKDPERAAMVLDLVKNDTYLNHLFRLGVEGVHYTWADDYTYMPTEKAADYPKDGIGLAWATRNADVNEYVEDERQRWLNEEQNAKLAVNPLEGFVFDDSSVQAEASACNEILKEYVPSLQLGLFDDYEAKIDEMMAALNRAGFEKLENEILTQYEAYYNTVVQ